MKMFWSHSVFLCLFISLCSGTSPLTNYANFWEEELEPVEAGTEQESFMAIKDYESLVSVHPA
jgi:hypothetical protein